MKVGGWRFEPRLVPTLATAGLVALTLSLAHWQVRRAEEKGERQALLETRLREPVVSLTGAVVNAEPILHRRVRAEGRYRPEGQIFIDNRQHQGRAGFHVVTPLRVEGGATLLVNRGWVARTEAYPRPPAVPVPEGPVAVQGLATMPPARVLELSAETVSGDVWQNLSIEKYRSRMRLDMLPIVLLAAPPGPGLIAVEDQPDAGILKHQEYALTWLALAVTAATLWVALNLRRATA